MDFPTGPVVGQQHPFTPVPGQPVFIWDGEKWVAAPLTGAVRYDAAQSLTGSQQTQARDNIGASSGAATGAVRYDTAQSLTAAQQLQARTNIYAAPFDAMAYSGMQINGGMEVSQEVAGAVTISNKYICDGWILFNSTTATASANVISVSNLGFINGLTNTVTAAQVTLTGSQANTVYQSIEGYRIARLAWGTANAQPITISFWTCHHRTGIYSVAVRNGADNRSYGAAYTQNAADVWEYKSITISGDTAGTWTKDNTAGMRIIFVNACGPTTTAPAADTWYGTFYNAAPGQVNGVAATSDVFRITGVTVLPGTQAPTAAQSPFIMRPYGEELATCQRYYYRAVWGSQTWLTVIQAYNANNASGPILRFPVTMRAVPTMATTGTIVIANPSGTSYAITTGTYSATTDMAQANAMGATGFATTAGYAVLFGSSAAGSFSFDARL